MHSPIHVEALDSAPFSPIGASFSLGSELGAPVSNLVGCIDDSISPFGSDRPIESLGILDNAVDSISDLGSGRDLDNPLEKAGIYDLGSDSASSNPCDKGIDMISDLDKGIDGISDLGSITLRYKDEDLDKPTNVFELASDAEDISIIASPPVERSLAHTSEERSFIERSLAHTSEERSLALGDISNIEIESSDIASPPATLSINTKLPVVPSVPIAPPPSAPRRFRNFYRGDSMPAGDRSCIEYIQRSPPISLVNMSQDIKSVSPQKASRLRSKRFREVLRPNLHFGPKFTSPSIPVRAKR